LKRKVRNGYQLICRNANFIRITVTFIRFIKDKVHNNINYWEGSAQKEKKESILQHQRIEMFCFIFSMYLNEKKDIT
jgi:hypothetical protein